MPPQQAISPVDVFLTRGHPSWSPVFDEEMLRRMQQSALTTAFVKVSPFLDLNPPVICSKTYVIDICIFRQGCFKLYTESNWWAKNYQKARCPLQSVLGVSQCSLARTFHNNSFHWLWRIHHANRFLCYPCMSGCILQVVNNILRLRLHSSREAMC